jgi:DNA invertase Pin-like site-specific DNA recombinase
MNKIFAYLRASTNEQDANRARHRLISFTNKHDVSISEFYSENASGADANRLALNSMVNKLEPYDIVLIESIDRLTRLGMADAQKLLARIKYKQANIVSLDLPITHIHFEQNDDRYSDDIWSINTRWQQTNMADTLINIMAVIANHDYHLRRERQMDGIKKAQGLGKYKGRKKDTVKRSQIRDLLIQTDFTYKKITELTGAQPQLIASVSKDLAIEGIIVKKKVLS